MNNILYEDALSIADYAIKESLPKKAVRQTLSFFEKPKGKTLMIAVGKAAYTMAEAALEIIDIDSGLVVTKYNHSKQALKNTKIIEAGHPVMDINSIKAGKTALEMVNNLSKDDLVVFLLSGGGSALFEDPLIPLKEYQSINEQLLKCGADINETNTVRKKLSNIKAGKFAIACKPARIFNVILSDVIGDELSTVGSGPTVQDFTSPLQALQIVEKYQLEIDKKTREILINNSSQIVDNVQTYIAGNNQKLIDAAKWKAQNLGYKTILLNKPITENINEALTIIKKYLTEYQDSHNIAIITGGEITINIKGNGLGGRNQEFAMRIAKLFTNTNIACFCIGSDGTDGPTDAAGAYMDIDLIDEEMDLYLDNNDSYHYLQNKQALIKTGPTGTNVCDLYCLLIK